MSRTSACRGLNIEYGWGESPFGPALVLMTQGKLCGLAFAEAPEAGKAGPGSREGSRKGSQKGQRRGDSGSARGQVLADMCARFRGAAFTEKNGLAPPLLARIMEKGGGRGGAAVPLFLNGSPFERRVWAALQMVPWGETRTYSDIAGAIGQPQAVRAVARAIGRNPVSWVIPCHRILRKDGGLGGYHWGLERKRAMLAFERAVHQVAL